MKKVLLLVFFVMLAGAGLFGWSQIQAEQPQLKKQTPIVLEEEDLSIWIITDLHYLSPDLFDDGKAFARMKATSAGKDLEHIPAMMEALVWEIAQTPPDLLLVTGDLTFNGEYQSMVELAQYFKQIEAYGTEVSVIPGNHDIHSGWARKFTGEEMERVEQVTPEDFRTLFADFGYDLAVFSDPNSLSYIIEPKPGFTFLMLDTNAYSETKSTKPPSAEGHIKPETYAWIREYMELQQDKNELILVGHHPLINHSGRQGGKFALEDAETARNFFVELGGQIGLSGHIHAQNITQQPGTSFYEIVTGALSIYPNSIGTMRLTNDAFHYERQPLAVSKWAEANGITDPALLDYHQTGYNFFKNDGEALALQMMFEEQWYDRAYQEDVMDFIGKLNVRYFSGEDFDPDPTLMEHPGYKIIQENSKTFLKRYSNQLLIDENLDDRSIVISFPAGF